MTDEEFSRIVKYTAVRYGINLYHKKVMVEGRLSNYLAANGFKSYTEYMDRVEADYTGQEAQNLINILTTNHTYFMREPEHFEFFKNVILPELKEREKTGMDLRIWSAAASSGQEPYTIAMILKDFLGPEYNACETSVLATDISRKVLDSAVNGIYSAEQISTLPVWWRNSYFVPLPDGMYQVKKELSEMTSQPKSTAEMYKTLYIVFANAEQIERIESFSYADKFNLKGDDGKQKEALEQIQNEFYEKFPDGTMESRMLSRSSFYKLYGGLFFIGIYLGSMFIMATVLIIYYKQISEGYDDRERYQIMQKVGMSKKEVKRSIRSQVLSVFFLPLVVAVIHVAVAFKVMTKILGVLNFTNVSLFAVCTIITIAVFAVFYIIVYSITAKEYYRIVN